MLEYYYDDQFKIFKLRGKLHQRIVLYKHNYYKHIKAEHPEVSIQKIIAILEEPDFVYKTALANRDYFYEKMIGQNNYRVVITDYRKHVKNVVTAYVLRNSDDFDSKRTFCIYDKNTSTAEELKSEQDEEYEYFLKLFTESEQ